MHHGKLHVRGWWPSATVTLPGTKNPRTYAEAMEQVRLAEQWLGQAR